MEGVSSLVGEPEDVSSVTDSSLEDDCGGGPGGLGDGGMSGILGGFLLSWASDGMNE